jgi:hypothetical protein
MLGKVKAGVQHVNLYKLSLFYKDWCSRQISDVVCHTIINVLLGSVSNIFPELICHWEMPTQKIYTVTPDGKWDVLMM